jgi:uncharacterized protein YPO0396
METTVKEAEADKVVEARKRRGFRLWRVEVLNWGTLGESTVHAADLRGDWLCITGRNGTGKSTLADAIVTAFPPARMRIHYNAAGGAKNTKERTTLTYLRGYFGHEQDETGKARPSSLRNKPGTLTAILLQFHEESSGRWVTLLVLGTFNAQNDEQWLYGIKDAKADLTAVQGKEDWEARAKRLRQDDWHLTADPGPYRDRLRTALRIPSDKAIATFVRTVGLKDIGDVNAFIRGNMLSDVSVHGRFSDLTKHYQKQLEIDAEIEMTRNMINGLKPLAESVPEFRARRAELQERPRIEHAVRWHLAETRAEVLDELTREQQQQIDILSGQVHAARNEIKRIDSELATLQASEPALRAATLARRSQELTALRRQVEDRANQLRGALAVIGASMPKNNEEFAQLRSELDRVVNVADRSDEERGDRLAKAKVKVEQMQEQRAQLQKHLDVLALNSSHLPREDLEVRAEIARAVGLKPADLPYVGELVDVDPAHHQWRIALEKLLRASARRILVPADRFGAVAAYVNSTDFGRRLRLEKVGRPQRLTMHVPDLRRAYSRLRIKPNSPFGDWLYNSLITHFDHVCFESVAEYEKSVGPALTIQGLLRGKGDYHEKRDDIRIRGPLDYFLGWDNEEKIRSLRAERANLDDALREAAALVEKTRHSNEDERQRRDLAKEVLVNVPRFELIDLGAVNQDIGALETQRRQMAQFDPHAAEAERLIAALMDEKLTQERTVADSTRQLGAHDQECRELKASLQEIEDWQSETTAPTETDSAATEIFFESKPPRHAKNLEKWSRGIEHGLAEHYRKVAERAHDAELRTQGLMIKYLSACPAEEKDLAPNASAADAFLERLRFLEDERLADLLDRFRKNLETNLALHVTQLKSELDSQVGDSERRIKEINKILDSIPWEGQQVIHILPRANPQKEIKDFRELLSAASAPLLAPSEERKMSAFAAVKALIVFLNDEGVRKLVLDARNWQLFAVELKDLAIQETNRQRKLYIENTDGLSGGQKNKLSVTLLASALAFQYDIAGSKTTPGTFRTVIIDEAFARLDSENARYALELFRKFDFQLILVHPLDGTVRVAEDYVQGFLLATIRDDKYSELTSVRIEDFRRLIADAEANGDPAKHSK